MSGVYSDDDQRGGEGEKDDQACDSDIGSRRWIDEVGDDAGRRLQCWRPIRIGGNSRHDYARVHTQCGINAIKGRQTIELFVVHTLQDLTRP